MINVENFYDYELDSFNPGELVTSKKWTKAMSKLKEIKFLIDKMHEKSEEIEIPLPDTLKNRILSSKKEFIAHIENFEQIKLANGIKDSERVDRYDSEILALEDWYNKIFLNNDPSKLLFTLSAITSLTKSKEEIIESELKSENISLKGIGGIVDEIKTKLASTESILDELQKKSSEKVASDYAQVFEKQADAYNLTSIIWLGVGFGFMAIFLILAFYYKIYDILPTEASIEGIVKYNISNLTLKVIIVALQIFLISFSFKQYSINRHLTTLNRHRQNGFNSFKLFTESIGNDDVETRNALMLQLAKVIYENNNTGFISAKGQDINSSFMELANMMKSTSKP